MWTSKSKQVAEYDYEGYQVVRFEPKDFKQRRPDGKGGWIWNLDGVERTLYRLPELRAADPAQFVFVPEGEKDVDRLRSWGKIATCNSGGAKKFPKSKGVEFTNRRVVILPDQDADGAEHRDQVIGIASANAKEVRVVNLPGVKDFSEWADQGHTVDELDKLVEATPSAVALQPKTTTVGAQLLEMSGTEVLAKATELGDLPYLPLLSVEGYFVQGWSHLVAGYPRVGKTDLILAACRQWARLGHRVLYITEEQVSLWAHRLKAWGGDWAELQLVFGLGYDPALLLNRAMEGPENIVVIDTVRSLLKLQDERDNSELARILTPWIAEAQAAGKTLVMGHHGRKGGGEYGEGIAGGHAIMGLFDIPMEVLRDPNQARNRRVVRTWPRLIEAKEGLYEKVADGEFIFLGDPDAVRLGDVVDRVRTLLTDSWQSTDEIWGGLDEPRPSKEQVRIALTDLAKQGAAERDPSIDSGPKHGKAHRWKRSAAGSGEVNATGDALRSNEQIYGLEPNSDSAFSNADPESEEMKAASEAKKKRRVFK